MTLDSISTTPKPPVRNRLRFRFSLRSLLLSAFTVGAAALFWQNRQVWSSLVLAGHTATVRFAAFSPDGKRLATTSDDGGVKIWDVQTGAHLLDLRGHSNEIYRPDWSPDGTKLLTASLDRTACVWDTKTGALLLTLKQDSQVITAVFDHRAERVVTAGGKVRVWNASTGAMLLEISTGAGDQQTPRDACFTDDGRQIISTRFDHVRQCWDAESGAEDVTQRKQTRWDGGRYFPDGKRDLMFVSGPDEYWVEIRDRKNGQVLSKLRGHTDWATGAAFSPVADVFATCSADKTARIWNRRRPDSPHGVAALPEFWLMVLFAAALTVSLVRDQRDLQ